MFKTCHLRHFLLLISLLFSAALFAQQYQGRDHTVFHPRTPPPAKHSSNPTAAGTTGAHATDSTARHHEATTSSNSHPVQPAQVSTRSK